LEIRAPSQIISGNIVNTTTAGLRLNGGSGNFSLQMFNNTGYQIDFANEVGPSVLFTNSANPLPGTMFKGAPSQLDFVFFDFGGGASNRYVALPLQTVHVAGWSPQFPQSNAVMAVIGDMAQTGNLHATNLSLSSSAQVGSSTFAALGAPTDGSILYCSDCVQATPCASGGSGALAMHAGGVWTCGGGGSTGPFNATTVTLVEEFMPNRTSSGMIGSLGWSASALGTGYSGYPISSVDNHPGIYKCVSNANAGDGCSITLTDSFDGAAYPISNMGSGGAFSSWEMQTIVATDPTGITHGKYFVGFSDNQAAYHPASGNSIAVRFDSAGGGCASGESTTNWVYEVSVNGAKTCVNSGLAVAANTWYKMRIYSTTAGTVNFQINAANSGTVAAAPTAGMTPQFMVLTTGTAAEALSLDWFAMNIAGLAR
jgi:hypothetical protein